MRSIFSPIHIASFLLPESNMPVARNLTRQLAEFKAQHGSAAVSWGTLTIDEMNQSFTPQQVDALIDEITANMTIALELIAQSEARRAPGRKLD